MFKLVEIYVRLKVLEYVILTMCLSRNLRLVLFTISHTSLDCSIHPSHYCSIVKGNLQPR